MVKRIEKLTKKQEQAIPAHVAKWVANAKQTGKTDPVKAEKAIRDVYRLSGLKEPTRVCRVDSPLVVSFAGPISAYVLTCEPQMKRSVKTLSPTSRVGRAVLEITGVSPERLAQYDQEELRTAVRSTYSQFWGGVYWSASTAYERFFSQICKLEIEGKAEQADAAAQLNQLVSWCWFHNDLAVWADFPKSLVFDAENRLHNAEGPAIEFHDGVSLYSLEGVTVPIEWITNKNGVDPKLALTWEDVEQRRVLRNHLTWARVLEAVGTVKVLHKDPSPYVGELLQVDLQDDDGKPAVFLKMFCVARQEYCIERVDPSCKTAQEAQEWRLPELPYYNPEVIA